jgi:serine/threonine-protein kinase
MSNAQTQPYSPLEVALVVYELARERGEALDRDEFLARFPEIADELRPLFDAVTQIEHFACPLREALAGRPPLAVPVIEGYEILEQIGMGGMGIVYKARQRGPEQLVALKLLRPDWLAGLDEPTRREALEQFRNEARLAARLRHPNRVRILHLGEHEGRPFIVMELIQGCSLAELLKRPGGVSKDAVVKYLTSIAEVLQDAHDRGILHRDIKPGNILIDEQTDEAKLTDFGLALLAPLGAGPEEQSVRAQARVVGTFLYMPPEQTEDADSVTVRSDIYSLGATLYEALTGTPPFTGTSRAQLLDKIRNDKPEPPRRHNREIDPELERICLRCLRKAPQERYASAQDLAEMLRGFTREHEYILNFTTMGTWLLALAPVGLVIHLVVWGMLQGAFWEPVVWLVFFSPYLKLAPGLLLTTTTRLPGRQGGVSWREYWSRWVGHIVATTLIAVALRTGLAVPARDVILLMYPVLAALAGLVFFIEASKQSWKQSWGPVGFWLVGVVMLFHREAAPIYYGVYEALASVAYGLHLRKLGKQFGRSKKSAALRAQPSPSTTSSS